MHRLLDSQLQRLWGQSIPEGMRELFASIDRTYHHVDTDRRQMELNHAEQTSELRQKALGLEARVEKLEKSQETLTDTVAMLRATLESTQEALWVIGRDAEHTFYNPNFLVLWGLKPVQLDNADVDAVFRLIQHQLWEPTTIVAQRARAVIVGITVGQEYPLRDGRAIEAFAHHHPVVGVVWSFRDVTDRRKQEEKIRHQAHHDALTGMPNRNLFNDRLAHGIAKLQRVGGKLAVLYLDLDGFKTINDSLGHAMGDELLRAVAGRLSGVLRDDDTIARFGGDEFALLLEDVEGHANVVRLAERMMEVFRSPYHIGEHEFHITSSIGIALYPDDGETADILIRNADIAMYKAKDSGRNHFHFFTPALERLAKHRLSLETRLRHAVKNEDFQLYYQPITALGTGKLLGFEALLRWHTEDMGFIGPDIFIPVAEATGMIIPLSEWVMRAACMQSKAWRDQGFEDLYVAVNLSAKQFQHDNVYHTVIDTMDTVGVDPSNFGLEITESLVMQNIQGAVATLRRFLDNGIMVAMDDFGTGYSSLNYLKTLPISVMKIDRSFTRDVMNSQQDRAIVSSIITLGHNLSLRIVAEGVEELSQLEFLRDQGCDSAQGYFFGRPAPADQAIAPYLTPAQALRLKGT